MELQGYIVNGDLQHGPLFSETPGFFRQCRARGFNWVFASSSNLPS